ncbi:M23 family metallopeptidase [Alteromonas oceanisediminis]|uniref:M23 family metallopeptidase n=1 Tax=Alteromonas oceanisediminis TaxID=2836180 RepID=UPI001BDA8857|nr:M23 family metallopeptidase [Alteromonas oceanisediminis]MBT0585532.1 M23 family metallopeptidase [Alteromonas oceanisediminis]
MKFTILIRSKRFRFAKQVGARTLVSTAVLASLLMLISSRSTSSLDETLARIHVTKSGLEQEKARAMDIAQQAKDELSVLKRQLASMEAKLREVDVLSQHVATQAGIEYTNVSGVSAQGTPHTEDTVASFDAVPLVQSILQLEERLDQKVKQLTALESVMLGHHIQDISEVAGKPIQTGWLSSYYGMRKDPFNGKPAMHKGIDFAGKDGDPVVATAAGLVTWAGERYGYGNLVEIDHGNGLVSRYGHNADLNVAMGDVVTKGQVIASMGSTGRSTGAHVHYEVLRQGKQIDPLPFVY